MNFRDKIVSWEALASWRKLVRANGKKLVVTNGVFDVLHVGHVTYLEKARNLGDSLLVGITCDKCVEALKGEGRPINTEDERAMVLAALSSVDGVCVFQETTAVQFLKVSEPDIYAKGGDYTIETINQEERQLMEKGGTPIVIIPGVPGKSTTGILGKCSRR